jgi:type I restriction enzyme, S subunit
MREGWVEMSLGSVAHIRLGKMLSRASREHRDRSPYLRNANVQWDELRLDDLKEMHFSEDERVEFSLRAGDVLVCEGGEVGRCVVLESDLHGIYFQKALHRVRCGKRLDPRFLTHILRYAATNGGFADLATQNTIQHLTKEKLEQLIIGLPSLDEQRRIVSVLAACDDVIDRKRRAQIALMQLRSAVLAELLEPRDGWQLTTLGEIADVVGGGTPATKTPEYWNGEVPWITPTEVVAQDGKRITSTERTITQEGLSRSAARLLPVDAVLLTSRATIGAVALAGIELATNQGFASFVCGPEALPRFLMLWCQANRVEFTSRGAGATFKEVSKNSVRAIPIALPPIDEQLRIADVINTVDQHLDALTDQGRAAGKARGAFLVDLLSGAHEIPESYDELLAGAAST